MGRCGNAIRSMVLGGSLLLGTNLQAAGPAEPALLQGIAQLDQAVHTWDPQALLAAAQTFQQAVTLDPQSAVAQYWLGAAHYHLATYFLYARPGDRDPKAGEAQVDAGVRALRQATQLDPQASESFALLGVLQGMKLQLNVWTALSNGPAIEANRNQALKLDPDNPRVHFLTGVSMWFAPEILGEREQALVHLLRAEQLFAVEHDRSPAPLEPTWGYSTCLTFLGDVYARRQEATRAYAYYQKALLIDPADQRALEQLETFSRSAKP